MSNKPSAPTNPHTRFARLYGDGSMGVMPSGTAFENARTELVDGHDDPDVELLEVEVKVIRAHGRPKLKAAGGLCVSCPTCGESIFVEPINGE